MFPLVVTPLLAHLVGAAWAQDAPPVEWSPLLQVRQRLLVGDRDATDDLAAGLSVSQRARLGLGVRRLGVSARVSFQDVRKWTATSDIAAPSAFLPSIAEGWVRVEGDLTRNVGAVATLGRQPLTLHEGRILGADEFSPEGQFFDAFRVEGRLSPVSIEYVNARRFLDPDQDPLGLGVNVFRLGASAENPMTAWTADAVWVVDARRTAETTSTAGVWLQFDTGRWRGRAEGYLQSSQAGTGTLVGLSGGWVFGPDERLVVYARYDGLSGDALDASGNAVPGGAAAWQPVLGDSRRFQGLLGRFDGPEDSDGRGLADAHLVVEARVGRPIATSLAFHRFWSPLDGGGFGNEIDGTARWSFSPFATAGLGGAWFAPDAAFDRTHRLFAYLELDAAF
ncbi:MAG: hypothetical protein Q8P41_18710 [Pseudomonadota bacterium]|nr:hypothetical protein [Pseudomonadota bacterium]